MKLPDLRPFIREYSPLLIKAGVVLLLSGAVFVLCIAPVMGEIERFERQVRVATVAVMQQEMFRPVYEKLLRQGKEGPEFAYPMPKIEPVGRLQVFDAPAVIERTAAQAGLEVLQVSLSPVAAKAEQVMVQGVFAGEPAAFRNFYVALGGLPFLQEVEKVELRAVTGNMEYLVQAWIALKREEAGK